ncbi:MAG: ABC transporter ATP-binding protein [Myxococcota bacterium]
MSTSPAIAATGLCRRYAARWALRGVDLRVERGRALMIVGANGAGKTTLVRVLGTALRPTQGSLELLGCAEPRDARPKVALLSHADGHYDDLTARENLAFAARAGGADADALLERVGLAARRHDVVRTFSAGMRKRLSFARLLCKRADLVLLDEPYAGMDPAGHAFVDGLLRELRAGGTTVVLSTHQVARGAELCDDAVRLDAGKVAWAGPARLALESA